MSPRRSQEAQNEAQQAAQNSGEILKSGGKTCHFGPPGGPWATQEAPGQARRAAGNRENIRFYVVFAWCALLVVAETLVK